MDAFVSPELGWLADLPVDPASTARTRRQRLRAAALLQPLYHGIACDGLSGLYAILDGFRLALAKKQPLTQADVDAIFREGLRFIERRGSLAKCVSDGLRQDLWRRLAEALQFYTERRLGVRLHVEQPFRHHPGISTAEALCRLEEMVAKQKATMMLRRGGHYCVVIGMTPHSVSLFDSSGRRWIRRECCAVVHGAARARHGLYPRSFTTVCA